MFTAEAITLITLFICLSFDSLLPNWLWLKIILSIHILEGQIYAPGFCISVWSALNRYLKCAGASIGWNLGVDVPLPSTPWLMHSGQAEVLSDLLSLQTLPILANLLTILWHSLNKRLTRVLDSETRVWKMNVFYSSFQSSNNFQFHLKYSGLPLKSRKKGISNPFIFKLVKLFKTCLVSELSFVCVHAHVCPHVHMWT